MEVINSDIIETSEIKIVLLATFKAIIKSKMGAYLGSMIPILLGRSIVRNKRIAVISEKQIVEMSPLFKPRRRPIYTPAMAGTNRVESSVGSSYTTTPM